jgi:hypothetical protein
MVNAILIDGCIWISSSFVIRIKSIFVCTGDTWIALGSLRTAQYSTSDNISNSKIYMSEENNMGHTLNKPIWWRFSCLKKCSIQNA